MGKRASTFCEWRWSADPGLILITEGTKQFIEHLADSANFKHITCIKHYGRMIGNSFKM